MFSLATVCAFPQIGSMRDTILCQTCVNLRRGPSRLPERRRCAAGVRLPYPAFECDSYVRQFVAAPGFAGAKATGGGGRTNASH